MVSKSGGATALADDRHARRVDQQSGFDAAGFRRSHGRRGRTRRDSHSGSASSRISELRKELRHFRIFCRILLFAAGSRVNSSLKNARDHEEKIRQQPDSRPQQIDGL